MDRPTIVYDGTCRFCRAQMDRIRRWGGARHFDFAAADAPGLIDRYPALADADLSQGLRVVEPSGTVHVGAEAVYRIARRLNRTRWCAWLYRVPGIGWAARGVYAWIAANRYRLAGRCDDACER